MNNTCPVGPGPASAPPSWNPGPAREHAWQEPATASQSGNSKPRVSQQVDGGERLTRAELAGILRGMQAGGEIPDPYPEPEIRAKPKPIEPAPGILQKFASYFSPRLTAAMPAPAEGPADSCPAGQPNCDKAAGASATKPKAVPGLASGALVKSFLRDVDPYIFQVHLSDNLSGSTGRARLGGIHLIIVRSDVYETGMDEARRLLGRFYGPHTGANPHYAASCLAGWSHFNSEHNGQAENLCDSKTASRFHKLTADWHATLVELNEEGRKHGLLTPDQDVLHMATHEVIEMLDGWIERFKNHPLREAAVRKLRSDVSNQVMTMQLDRVLMVATGSEELASRLDTLSKSSGSHVSVISAPELTKIGVKDLVKPDNVVLLVERSPSSGLSGSFQFGPQGAAAADPGTVEPPRTLAGPDGSVQAFLADIGEGKFHVVQVQTAQDNAMLSDTDVLYVLSGSNEAAMIETGRLLDRHFDLSDKDATNLAASCLLALPQVTGGLEPANLCHTAEGRRIHEGLKPWREICEGLDMGKRLGLYPDSAMNMAPDEVVKHLRKWAQTQSPDSFDGARRRKLVKRIEAQAGKAETLRKAMLLAGGDALLQRMKQPRVPGQARVTVVSAAEYATVQDQVQRMKGFIMLYDGGPAADPVEVRERTDL
ncbi:MAG: hypothetical protein JWP36_121 [Paucimonas sp.]|nr:hypothetical protein [Paucimonas sp.]